MSRAIWPAAPDRFPVFPGSVAGDIDWAGGGALATGSQRPPRYFCGVSSARNLSWGSYPPVPSRRMGISPPECDARAPVRGPPPAGISGIPIAVAKFCAAASDEGWVGYLTISPCAARSYWVALLGRRPRVAPPRFFGGRGYLPPTRYPMIHAEARGTDIPDSKDIDCSSGRAHVHIG